MANYQPQSPTVTGIAPIPNPASSSDTYDIQPGTKYHLRLINGGGSSVTVTVVDVSSVSPVGATAFTPSVAVTVPNGTTRVVLVDAGRFRDSNGRVTINFSATVSNSHELWVADV
jgi:hypothetical protein